MTSYPLKDFTAWAEEGTRKLDAILRGQEDARKRMVDFIAALKLKEDWDESVLATMNSMAEQILEAAGDSEEAVGLAAAVREKAELAGKLLAERSHNALLAKSVVVKP